VGKGDTCLIKTLLRDVWPLNAAAFRMRAGIGRSVERKEREEKRFN